MTKAACLMSSQCMGDVGSCIIGFTELCTKLLSAGGRMDYYITPSLVNSDVVENEFNQQRSTYNGANTNPNALQYRRTLNSIIIGQSVISKKGNAGLNEAATAQAFSLQNPNLLRKMKRKQNPSLNQNMPEKIEVMRL